MPKDNSPYRHYIPALDLAIERSTHRTPQDGKFHVFYKGSLVESFSSLKKAEQKFYLLLNESGYKPPEQKKPDNPSDEAMERYMQAKEVFWAEGPKKIKGSRGGR